MELKVRQILSTECLQSFHCGVEPMDNFIHNGLQLSIDHYYCRCYVIEENNDIIALFALSFDSVDLDADDREELAMGFTSTGVPNPNKDTLRMIKTLRAK